MASNTWQNFGKELTHNDGPLPPSVQWMKALMFFKGSATSFEVECLPPTADTLLHSNEALYQAFIWARSDSSTEDAISR
ncbi:hypothetical protein Hamer_G016495 [Homarus americanus]|uniref:Uncharacterized protein n=1 Tax=Homarus americanus TaxID=6706 RepID=A0A8J5JQQ8_HOMAM|nr:hypothetical protein Hamer_G016495 [Homarus americanus]